MKWCLNVKNEVESVHAQCTKGDKAGFACFENESRTFRLGHPVLGDMAQMSLSVPLISEPWHSICH